MRKVVLQYIKEVTKLGETICDAMSVGLGLPPKFIRKQLLESPEPIQLFRSFKYSGKEGLEDGFGIGEHTDFGLLTLLLQNGPGLQVLSPHSDDEWIDVPVLPDGFVLNVGDFLDRLTGGIYRSRPHRVLPPSPSKSRISVPFFFDPAFRAPIVAFPVVPTAEEATSAEKRWASTTFRGLDGVWGQYLGVKVQKVFPALVLPEFGANARSSGRHLLEVQL